MSGSRSGMRQLVDWSAAIWAGLVAGLVFLLLNMLLSPLFLGSSAWFILRYLASPVLGQAALPPPDSFNLGIVLVGLLVDLALSVIYALLIAVVVHRGGLLTGIVGGALIGLAIYCINLYGLTLLFPWFFGLRSWILILSHILFGALAGGLYEAFEVEVFVPIESPGQGGAP